MPVEEGEERSVRRMNYPAASSGVSRRSLADTLAASGGELDPKRLNITIWTFFYRLNVRVERCEQASAAALAGVRFRTCG